MYTRAPARLPGIRFEVQPPPQAEVLPRMDVALFAGFAASGPVNVPVPVEDIAHFTDIFGADQPLAWDAQRSGRVYAYLAPAVRAFFRNGGQRCWIVRLTGPRAAANLFPINGLMQINADGTLSQAFAQARSVGSWSDVLRVTAVLAGEPVSVRSWDLNTPDGYVLTVALPPPQTVSVGDLLRLTFRQERLVALLAILAVTPGASSSMRVGGMMQWFSAADTSSPAPPPNPYPVTLPIGERLTFDLLVRQAEDAQVGSDAPPFRAAGLGFVAGHPRFWAGLPSDAQLFDDATPSLSAAVASSALSDQWPDAVSPRFPLCGGNAASTMPAVYMPVGMAGVLGSGSFLGPTPITGTPLDRDGLTEFSTSLFLDPALASSGTETLLAEADFLRYQQSTPRTLTGLHAALAIDEATIIAVPDAIHRGWTLDAAAPPLPPSVPSPTPPSITCNPPLASSAEGGQFGDCALLLAPALQPIDPPVGMGLLTLTWSAVTEADVAYALEEATQPDFSDSTTVYRGAETSVLLAPQGAGAHFYRVRAETPQGVGPWSNVQGVGVGTESRWRLIDALDFDEETLLSVHGALLRLCAARSDLFAVLSLPAHMREDDALRYAADLHSNIAEDRTLSFGAIYHPWLTGRENAADRDLRDTPSDGAVCGLIARRAIARGAWVAPANDALQGPVALTPPLAVARRLDLQEGFINVIRQEPQGFLTLCADTLTSDPELRPINVRRLLILLRRLALRLGTRYVFEPNDAPFRRLVQRGFEELLDDLYVRGAFAGATASAAFHVDTGPALNTPTTVDQGRFTVELRVAPSRALTFMTIRLVQMGDRALVVQEQ